MLRVEQREQPPDRHLGFEKIVAGSQVMWRVFDQARRAAKVDATVLVMGESGTGKELIAEAIHAYSPRACGPFVAINMAAVPETLVESELFGHIEGAFTGAVAERTGRFEAADGGTIFIDEIGDLKLACQAKMLRVLENHCVTPVGSNDGRKVDVRIVAATNRNLERMVAAGDFREDLYYRLNVVTINLPPLRKRRQDILLLVQHFLDEMCRINGRLLPVLETELEQFLQNYDWPGNVRQLRNCVESMVVLADTARLGLDDLPTMVRTRRRTADARLDIPRGFTLEDVERAVVLQTLDGCQGNRTQAARTLGISVRTLQRRLKRWQDGNECAGVVPPCREELPVG
jgi:transcriptional regulator with PAS, ATPase and Fis domain